jgi:hypothetical protein
MDDILQWMDDDDDLLASIQTTIGLILKTKEKKKMWWIYTWPKRNSPEPTTGTPATVRR